jgi:hypothetical protein
MAPRKVHLILKQLQNRSLRRYPRRVLPVSARRPRSSALPQYDPCEHHFVYPIRKSPHVYAHATQCYHQQDVPCASASGLVCQEPGHIWRVARPCYRGCTRFAIIRTALVVRLWKSVGPTGSGSLLIHDEPASNAVLTRVSG